MGTNFYINYTKKELKSMNMEDDMDPCVHIGKRSAAGMWCWSCDITLCKEGNAGLHQSKSSWYDKCPVCGQKPRNGTLEDSAAGKELGFNKKPLRKETGVSGCCSFSWAMNEGDLLVRIKDFPKSRRPIRNEYDETFTLKQFKKMLKEDCPVQYFSNIGKWFS